MEVRRLSSLLLCLLFALPTAAVAGEVQRWDSKLEQKIKEHEGKEPKTQEQIFKEVEEKIKSTATEDAVKNHSIILGMTKAQVIASLGRPDRIHKSVYEHGVHEQWVYEVLRRRVYLHFEDGVLKSWSD